MKTLMFVLSLLVFAYVLACPFIRSGQLSRAEQAQADRRWWMRRQP